jgi:hypothetical protein
VPDGFSGKGASLCFGLVVDMTSSSGFRDAQVRADCGETCSPKQAPPLLFPQSQPWINWATGSHSLLRVVNSYTLRRAQSAGCTLKQAPTLLLIRSTTQKVETELSGSRSQDMLAIKTSTVPGTLNHLDAISHSPTKDQSMESRNKIKNLRIFTT